MRDQIIIKGARQHNLKNIDLALPKNKLIVFTGVSGSGKSSLAFDTIYAEGQRRYVESLSSYARQFLGVMDKPDVDSIEGLSPSISIDQKSTSHNPRSTVGTVTEIYDYLRLLFARVGRPKCPNCGREIERQTSAQIVKQIIGQIRLTRLIRPMRLLILSPIIRDRKGEFRDLFNNLKSKGFTQVRIDGRIFNLSEDLLLIKTNKHTIDVVVDRITADKNMLKREKEISALSARLAESIELATNLSEGLVSVSEVADASFSFPEKPKKMTDHLFSQKFACPSCNISIPEIEPRLFSFNSPAGACPLCMGLGSLLKIDADLILRKNLSINEGGILPFARLILSDTWYGRILLTAVKSIGIQPDKPLKYATNPQIQKLLYGTGDKIYEVTGENRYGKTVSIYETFAGVTPELERRLRETESEYVRSEISKYLRTENCPSCHGERLKKEALSVTIFDKSISDVTRFSIREAVTWMNSIQSKFSEREKTIANLIIKEIVNRLSFLMSVGLDYLTLQRKANSLAGGEAQRIRLASQIGSGLSGVLYVLDEPSIGLHPRDNYKLISTLKKLRDLGNSVIVVEHDREMMENADLIYDFGPGAGEHGGKIVACGTVDEIKNNPYSITGKYLSNKKVIETHANRSLYNYSSSEGYRTSRVEKPAPSATEEFSTSSNNIRRGGIGQSLKTPRMVCVCTPPRWRDLEGGCLVIRGCQANNLKNIDVSFPLNKFICVTGVSGSGKSTLIVDTLYHALASFFNPFHREKGGFYKEIKGLQNLKRVILIDQSPIGRTPRSNPATYTGAFTYIRDLFAATPQARAKGFTAGRFSFNVKGGRCEACEGEGQTKIEMQFLPDVYVTCDVCNGTRFNSETLEIHFKGKNIAEILHLTVEEGLSFFANIPGLFTKLDTLNSVGLSYIHLGQPAPQLSGGEAQRVKLATELSKKATRDTLFILDEPTTGLHFADLEKLLNVLRQLVAMGNTVIVIEHNLDVVKNADWIIDLGPEGGEDGGRIIAQGTSQQLTNIHKSYTGQFLKNIMNVIASPDVTSGRGDPRSSRGLLRSARNDRWL